LGPKVPGGHLRIELEKKLKAEGSQNEKRKKGDSSGTQAIKGRCQMFGLGDQRRTTDEKPGPKKKKRGKYCRASPFKRVVRREKPHS